MPFPLIPIAVAVVVISGGAALALRLLWKKLDGKNVAILGARQVGKTALLNALKGDHLPERSIGQSRAPFEGQFAMEVSGKTVQFDVPRDLPGDSSDVGFKLWREAFLRADYVWYLFRADLLAAGDLETVERITSHLDRFKDWLDSSKTVRPRIVLIGTYADNSPEYGNDALAFIDSVRSSAPLKLGLVRLNYAGLVVGTLGDIKGARKLIRHLRSQLQ